jgi:hypothetical protein
MFLRNQFAVNGRFDIPIIHRQNIDVAGLEIIGLQNASRNDPDASNRIVHGFKDDPKIDPCYNTPSKVFKKLENYACLCTPNYSFFSNMPTALQIEAVFRSHWVGAYWQSKGKQVLANTCWGMPDSYDFCFDGYEKGLDVIISTMGASRTKAGFLSGYEEMLKRLRPRTVWCYCTPFPEMKNIDGVFPYEASAKKHILVDPRQTDIFSILDGGDSDVSTWGTIRRIA